MAFARTSVSIAFLALSLCAAASLAVASPAPADWRKESEGDGITIFSKEIEGSPLIAFRGVGIVDAPIARLMSILLDTQHAPEWVDRLEESRIIRFLSPNEYIEYNHIGTPFILKDRDFVSKVIIEKDVPHKRVVVTYRSAEDPLAPKTDYVRGEIKHSQFIFTVVEGGAQTQAEGEIHADPKGALPKWVVNLFQKAWPRVTLENLRRQVAKPGIPEHPEYKKIF